MRKLTKLVGGDAWRVALLVVGLLACGGCVAEEEPATMAGEWLSVVPSQSYWMHLDEIVPTDGSWLQVGQYFDGEAGCVQPEHGRIAAFRAAWKDLARQDRSWELHWYGVESCTHPYDPSERNTLVWTSWHCDLDESGDTLTCKSGQYVFNRVETDEE